MTHGLIRGKFGHTQREVREVRTEVEIRGRYLQAKDCWQHSELGGDTKQIVLMCHQKESTLIKFMVIYDGSKGKQTHLPSKAVTQIP